MFYPTAKRLQAVFLFAVFLLSVISGLTACANLSPAQQQERGLGQTAPEPPQLSTTIEVDLSQEPTAADADSTDDPAPPPAVAQTMSHSLNDALLPGLNRANTGQVEERYESSLQTRKKRVDLGLDRERENQPVNNVFDWEF